MTFMDVLKIKNLSVDFLTDDGVVKAVENVSLDIYEREALGIVGESGSGKSTIALAIMRLIPYPGEITNGEIFFMGDSLLKKTDSDMRKIRGAKIAMCFQDPMTFLNPVMKIGDQIAEVVVEHQKISKKEALTKAISTLELLKISSPESVAMAYPHQLSGGMQQRVMLALAISCRPGLLIADEPTTAIDVVIQSQILDVFKNTIEQLGNSVLIITHDLGVVAELCDRIAVMYAGNIVECAKKKELLQSPKHPYTLGLINSSPRLHSLEKRGLEAIPGNVPNLLNPPEGCKFHPRCKYAVEKCRHNFPEYTMISDSHFISCYKWQEIGG